MLRNIMITGTALCLSMGSSLARADHDPELRYVVGGAILGAALGELAYASDYGPAHGRVIVGYGYRPGIAYAPMRFYRRGYDARHWGYRRHAGHRHGLDRRRGRYRH